MASSSFTTLQTEALSTVHLHFADSEKRHLKTELQKANTDRQDLKRKLQLADAATEQMQKKAYTSQDMYGNQRTWREVAEEQSRKVDSMYRM